MKNQIFKNDLKYILACSYNVFSSPRDSKHIGKLFPVPKTISKLVLWGSQSDGNSTPEQNPCKFSENHEKSLKTKISKTI